MKTPIIIVYPDIFEMNERQTYRGQFYVGWMRGMVVYCKSLLPPITVLICAN